MKTTIIKLDPRRPDPDQLRYVAGLLLRGKVVAFPTETVYGLMVCSSQPSAIVRLNELKQRSAQKPYSYHIGGLDALERLEIVQSRPFRYLVNRFWPGPVTLVALNRKDEKVGLRFPKNEIAIQIINQCSEPIVATSANISGEKSPVTAEGVLKIFPNELDIVVDGGPCELGGDSTVVDTVTMPPEVLRPGVYADRVEEAIQNIKVGKYPRKYILIVCTGNTCRSPMAEGWLRTELKKRGLDEQIQVNSCGMFARDGQLPTAETSLVLRNDEILIDGFRTRRCRRADIINADLILAMTDEHLDAILEMCPDAGGKIMVLDVTDPIGTTFDFYKEIYHSIQEKILKIWEKIVK